MSGGLLAVLLEFREIVLEITIWKSLMVKVMGLDEVTQRREGTDKEKRSQDWPWSGRGERASTED